MSTTKTNKAHIQNKFGNTQFSLDTSEAVYTVIDATLSANKAFYPDAGKVGDQTQITVNITNTNPTIAATEVYVTDPMLTSLGMTFVAGSAKVNNIANPGNPLVSPGILVGTIPPAGTATVTFSAIVGA